MSQNKLKYVGIVLAAAFVAIILMLAFRSSHASAATIIISGTNPVAERTVQVPGCTKLTTGVNTRKENIGVICEHVYASPPLGGPAPMQPPVVKAAPAEAAKK